MISENNPFPGKFRLLDIQCCPACCSAVRAGELTCSKCGFAFTFIKAGKTRQVEKLVYIAHPGCELPDEPLLDKAIMFEIDGLTLPLPPAQQLIIGRRVEDSLAPDIDLSQFNAQDKGVSRQHLCISRNFIIYATDLGSTNGTFLNGQRLVPGCDHSLNNGDYLWLGQLVIKVTLREPMNRQ